MAITLGVAIRFDRASAAVVQPQPAPVMQGTIVPDLMLRVTQTGRTSSLDLHLMQPRQISRSQFQTYDMRAISQSALDSSGKLLDVFA